VTQLIVGTGGSSVSLLFFRPPASAAQHELTKIEAANQFEARAFELFSVYQPDKALSAFDLSSPLHP
jgi:hypothetical protein